MREYTEELDRIMNWEEKTKRPTLSHIEEQPLAARKRIGEGMLEELLRGEENQSPVEAEKGIIELP